MSSIVISSAQLLQECENYPGWQYRIWTQTDQGFCGSPQPDPAYDGLTISAPQGRLPEARPGTASELPEFSFDPNALACAASWSEWAKTEQHYYHT
jgi:hypothetical protein